MIEYYERLTAQATAREEKALWHVRRKQLALARLSFLEEDEAQLRREMEDRAGLGEVGNLLYFLADHLISMGVHRFHFEKNIYIIPNFHGKKWIQPHSFDFIDI